MLIHISFCFLLDQSPSIALSFQSVLLLNFTQYVGYVKVVRWISNKLLHGFCKVDTWISLSCHMYLSKDCYTDFSTVKKDLLKLDFQNFSMHLSTFAKQNQAEVWPRFQSFLKLLLWTKGVEWVKVLNALAFVPLAMYQDQSWDQNFWDWYWNSLWDKIL